ncbi:MAG: lysylphosphatidylglycerol synthase transmembrane domain-containing protein [Bacteroidales bacterium]
MNKKIKERLILVLKIILSSIAVIYVLSKISLADIAGIIKSSHIVFLGFALVLFIISKILASFRTLLILNRYGIPVSMWDNLKLYWAGMFYNLFLPGGIGGDVYKTVVINSMHSNGLKISAGSVLMDRIGGVAALIALALLFIPFTTLYDQYGWVTFAGVPLSIIGFIVIILVFMPRLKRIAGKLLGWSFLVQIFQILTVILILRAFNINTGQPSYLFIFLVSSLAAMLPISVGGIGIRELVFLSFSTHLLLDREIAVAISITFYLITLIASIFGAIPAMERRKSEKNH